MNRIVYWPIMINEEGLLNHTSKINLAYYPECALSSTAREIDVALHQVCDILDIRLIELPDWICYGSSSVHAIMSQLAILLAARNLFQAQDLGQDLLVMCAEKIPCQYYNLFDLDIELEIN